MLVMKKNGKYKPQYGNKYRKERAELLLNNPRCVYCGGVATTADHVPPVSVFPDPSEWVGELVPACKPCNSSKGAQLRSRRNPSRQMRSRNW